MSYIAKRYMTLGLHKPWTTPHLSRRLLRVSKAHGLLQATRVIYTEVDGIYHRLYVSVPKHAVRAQASTSFSFFLFFFWWEWGKRGGRREEESLDKYCFSSCLQFQKENKLSCHILISSQIQLIKDQAMSIYLF
jgi:hypothetical protein